MTLRTRAFAVLIAIVAVAAPLQAQIYDNGAPNGDNGNEMTDWWQAEDFTLGSAFTIDAVRFWAIFDASSNAYAGSIFWQILSDDTGGPGSVIAEGTANPTSTYRAPTPYGSSYQFDFAIAPLTLGAGTFWLALHNGALSSMGRDEFYWETTAANTTAPGQERNSGSGYTSWTNNDLEHAFQLYGGPSNTVTPEPISMALLGTGLAGVAAARRRKRQAQDA